MKKSHNHFFKLAFEKAKINLGKTSRNPSVGCIVVKNNNVISSGYTSINGRPHAEYNALKTKIDYKNSDMYVTMEPCTHYGLTPPCSKLIIKKKIRRVFFANYDIDKRSAKKIKSALHKKRVKAFYLKNKNFNDFYQSYIINRTKNIPLIDAKIAISKDYFTINKKSKWITCDLSRQRAHLLRSEYEAVISTSKTINKDNSQLNCRLKGFDNYKPDLIIIDLNLKIKKKLKIFYGNYKEKIIIITKIKKSKKLSSLKKKIKIINIKELSNKNDFNNLFKRLKKVGYNRILIESGLLFLNSLLKMNLINNLFLFQTSKKLGNKGTNNATSFMLKRIKLINKIKVNLKGDSMYKVKIR